MPDYLSSIIAHWKEGSIVLTALLAMLGLSGEYRERQTGRITNRGRIFLVATIVSACVSVLAQLHDAEINRLQKMEADKKSQETLTELSRLLQPLDGANITMVLKLDCSADRFRDFCNEVKSSRLGRFSNPARESGDQADNSDVYDSLELPISLDAVFFKSRKQFEDFLAQPNKNDLNPLHEGGDIDFPVTLRLSEKNNLPNFLTSEVSDGIELSVMGEQVKPLIASDKILSMVDIPGSTVALIGDRDVIGSLEPTIFEISASRAVSKVSVHFEKMKWGNEGIFVYSFPPAK